MDKYISDKEAAELIGVSVATLKRWRANDEGPAYYKPSHGIVRYSVEDIREWMDGHRVGVER